jgi:tRNA (Thr-GGU) A37 N-methylase
MHEAPERFLRRFGAARTLERDRTTQGDGRQKLLPLFCSRSSPNVPNPIAVIAALLESTARQRITVRGAGEDLIAG